MITLLRKIFIDNWQRKLVSLILAIIVWMIVNHSMTAQRTVHNIPVKILNLPEGKTVEGLQANGVLNRRISLTIAGNQTLLQNLTGNDLQVVIDAKGKKKEWIASITKKNLLSINPEIDVFQGITRVSHHDLIIKMSKLISEQVPILVTQPVGEAPKGYQFLDIWPYHLNLTVTGPEDTVKRLKNKGLKLTFNLSDISYTELDNLQSQKNSDEISFFIPESWKKVSVPTLSESPLTIDDTKAKSLRIDFVKRDLIAINNPIPVSVFYPLKLLRTLNPETAKLQVGGMIEKRNGIFLITTPLFAKGVSRLFVETVKDRLEVSILAGTKNEQESLKWNIQFIYPHDLENRYINKALTDYPEDDLHPKLREEYLRNRFRSFMHQFRLYNQKEEKLSLKIQQNHGIISMEAENQTHK